MEDDTTSLQTCMDSRAVHPVTNPTVQLFDVMMYPNATPALDYFMNAYMHQDYALFGKTLPEVIKVYTSDASPDDVAQLKIEIAAFIKECGTDLESVYYSTYPNGVLPSGWGMSVKEWLLYVATLVDKS